MLTYEHEKMVSGKRTSACIRMYRKLIYNNTAISYIASKVKFAQMATILFGKSITSWIFQPFRWLLLVLMRSIPEIPSWGQEWALSSRTALSTMKHSCYVADSAHTYLLCPRYWLNLTVCVKRHRHTRENRCLSLDFRLRIKGDLACTPLVASFPLALVNPSGQSPVKT